MSMHSATLIFGHYDCIAANSEGENTASVEIAVLCTFSIQKREE